MSFPAPLRRDWIVRGAHLLHPKTIAEWTLDTVAMTVDCPPELWKMSHDDRVVAVRMLKSGLGAPLVKLANHLPHRRRRSLRR